MNCNNSFNKLYIYIYQIEKGSQHIKKNIKNYIFSNVQNIQRSQVCSKVIDCLSIGRIRTCIFSVSDLNAGCTDSICCILMYLSLVYTYQCEDYYARAK